MEEQSRFVDVSFWLIICLVSAWACMFLAYLIEKYTENKKYKEELLFNIIFASGGIAFMLFFAFQRIIGNAGLYFLSVWTPIAGYFVVATLIVLLLDKYWTSPYKVSKEIRRREVILELLE